MNAELTNSDIAEATIGPRSRVATSPDELKGCKWELEADTEKFIETIEVFLVTPHPPKKRILANSSGFRKLFTIMLGASTMC